MPPEPGSANGRRLVVNADDFGLTEQINAGIVRAHVAGIVTSCSLMVAAPAARSAARLAGSHPELSVGLHFVEPDGVDLDQPRAAGDEVARQLEAFRVLTGADPTHLDSHHHVHLEGDRLAAFSAAASPIGIPVRGDGTVRYVGGFYGQWEWGVTDLRHVSPEYLGWLLAHEVLEGATELGCHPAAGLESLHSSYGHERVVELDTLTRVGLRERVAEHGIRLVNFRDVAGRAPQTTVRPPPSAPPSAD